MKFESDENDFEEQPQIIDNDLSVVFMEILWKKR